MGVIVSPSLLDGNFHKILPSWNTNGVLSSPETLTESLQHEQTSAVALADPRIDDRPQLGSRTEWYYFQAHLTSEISDEPLHTVFVCIFRHSPHGDKGHCWAVVYAVLDWRTQKYAAYSKVPNGVPAGVARMMETSHPRLSSIIQDLVDTGPSTDGTPFLPDTPFTSNVEIRQSEGPALQLDWDNGAFIVGENGSYHLKVPEIELDIQLQATRPMMLHGYDGVTCKDDTHKMFYYSWPRTAVVGQYQGTQVVGTAWVDHEYSLGVLGSQKSPDAPIPGWNWFSLVTSGPSNLEICITQIFQEQSVIEEYIVYMDNDGKRRKEDVFSLFPTKSWVSAQTFQKFGTSWKLTVPSLNIDIDIEAVCQNQEFQTWIRLPSFYEGAVRFSGTWEGAPIRGFGAMELANETTSGDKYMEVILDNASALVRAEIENVVPKSLCPNHFEYLTDVSFDSEQERIIQESIVDPFYLLNNRGGKNWRPMLLSAAASLVGGDANDWRPFLVIPEMIHTASLIIDDIQDESETRRGGLCVHKVVGIPTAINAGCAMYFWGETIVRDCEALTETQRRDYYATYFEMMRVAHSGQALDIAGMTMDNLPSIEEAKSILSRVVNMHRCKSGKPASCCGVGGSRLGGGTKEQTDAIGLYVQNLGLAFQIRDDVLDVLGKVKGKNAADDLYNHKITYPVAKLFTLDHPDREKWFQLWEDRDVPGFVEALESSGTMELCKADIEGMILDGWAAVNSLTPNSFSKVLFRTFGEFLIEQHY
ncbi:hypothetical protein LMH87_007370 [Akanthomyces muscarius]|uniref:AttH domain-containing protein n=1 Tax=Akanthomyces muscarius TaxID=2231603 RepID=A0A9W8QQP6_AKAMU|nr:hypothetical protein LMH87_007370 [Akanthomyces muscarius]KAJ4165750.1 hypothetical protein LMH87_007370 [Akanthomyces muscarius]